MNAPAGHDSAHAKGEDRKSGGTGGASGSASVRQLDTTGKHSPPSHHTTTSLLNYHGKRM